VLAEQRVRRGDLTRRVLTMIFFISFVEPGNEGDL
jgi:hypothetical protein